jgi:II/X family phage/plasmid replication protein
MIEYFTHAMDVRLTDDLRDWECSRVDVTRNYLLSSAAEVRQALACLSATQGGHYRVQSHSGTVYWNKSSQLRSGKAYHKGPHLEWQVRKGQASASPGDVELCARLLRLELALRGQFWRERSAKRWHEWTAGELEAMHGEYFGAMVGTMEVVEMNSVLAGVERVAVSRGAASAAYNTWLAIRAEGLETVRARMNSRTFHRHKRLLFDAGLSWSDLQASNVVPLRRRSIELGAAVESWADLRRAA